MQINKISFFTQKSKIQNFKMNEIFFSTSQLINHSNFSNQLDYLNFKCRFSFNFKTKLKLRCITTQKSKYVSKKAAVSRFQFSQLINSSFLTGFYRSV